LAQLATLIWLKWTLFRNSLRSSKAVINRIASILAMLAALALALLIALGLGIAAYVLTSPDIVSTGAQALQEKSQGRAPTLPPAEFVFFSIFAMCYLLWATLPLSIGSSRQFDPGNLLLYPVSLRKLFAVDFVSDVASLQAVFAIPAIIAIGIGAGLAQGRLAGAILMATVAAAFGLALSKWVSTSIGSLIRKKRARGETLLAVMGAIAGLGGLLFSQIAPAFLRHAESISALRWTPPGALAFALTQGLREGQSVGYALALLAVTAYTVVLMAITYWLARRAILGGGTRRRASAASATVTTENYTGWQIPLAPPDLAAIIEKELRYIMRNAQLRMMSLMPLILIIIRLMNRRNFDQTAVDGNRFIADLFKYGEGFMATTGVLYVFLILSGLSCNQFAFEHAGMRTLVLSPVDRKRILLGKNIAICTVALVFSAGVLAINQLVFRDVTLAALLFAGLSFLIFAAMTSMMGNWFSIRFPKRMKFGARMNVSGVVGLLLIPMIILLALPPLASAAVGYVAQSLLIEYATLTVLAALSVGFYLMMIATQGESLRKRELEILEAVNDPGSD
jgi:Membrane protein of 12 TMs